MIQSLAFPLSEYRYLKQKDWGSFAGLLYEQGLSGLEILADERKLWEPIPPSLVKGYQMRAPLDWLGCYLGEKIEYIRDFVAHEEAADSFKSGNPEDILRSYRADLDFGLSLKPPYVVFDVSNADRTELCTLSWSHSDYWVIDAAVEILNELLKAVKPDFILLLGNNRWPGFTFTEPRKTEYLLSRINYPNVGIMLDTARLLSENWRTKNQGEAIEYIHSVLDDHGGLCKSILGLHFSYLPTAEWSKRSLKMSETSPEDYQPLWWTPEISMKFRIRKMNRHSCWTNPECISLIDRIEPQFLVHIFHDNGALTRMGVLTRQLKAIRKGRELRNGILQENMISKV